MEVRTVKGFRDFLPVAMRVRSRVLTAIREVFERFGFEELQTPALEYASVLEGKYGEEEKLIYKFETPGGDRVALRYDQTVPLARVMAQFGPKGKQKITIPFKRYQIQPSYRGENTQKGRYREFWQCDVDIVGVESGLADAEILALVFEAYKALGLDVDVKVNDRVAFEGLENKFLASLDKMRKIGRGGVLKELQERGMTEREAQNWLSRVEQFVPTERLVAIIDAFEAMGLDKSKLVFDPFLIRGLDYYTGMIVEVVPSSNKTAGSLGGGGRWDSMIGKFTGVDTPAVGFSIGLDRVIEEMGAQGLQRELKECMTKVLVSVFDVDLAAESLKLASRLRSSGINTEVWLEINTKLDKQLKYADQKGIPYVVILGSNEIKEGKLLLKEFSTGQTQMISTEQAIEKLLRG